MQNDELIARLQAATGWDDDLDLALAEWAQDNNIPIPPPYYDGGPINYDPRLWLERHDWRPTASIDAALTLVPEGWHLATLGFIHPDFRQETELDWRADIFGPVTWAEDDGFPEPQYEAAGGNAHTPALAICIAALKARSRD